MPHNPTRFKATFSGLIVTAFDKEQTLKLKIEITMYQLSNCPEKWTFTPTLPTGRQHLEASSPAELAKLIEETFVERLTPWTKNGAPQRVLQPKKKAEAGKVIEMPLRRRSA